MASIRGILNIQSLNELTSENVHSWGRTWGSAGRIAYTQNSQQLDDK